MLATYYFLYPHLSHRFYKVGGQERANYARAQQYVYEVPSRTNVIVGSSMANQLDESILGPNYFKLTFPGKRTLTALEIVLRAHKRPGVVLIETNTVDADVDSELLHDLFSPWLSALRRCSPIFKGEGRPANFLVGIASTMVSKSVAWSERIFPETKTGSAPSPQSESLPSPLFAQVLREHQMEFGAAPSATELTNRINQLADDVAVLGHNGSSICVFFELPIDSSLAQLRGSLIQRRMVHEHFPLTKYHWVVFAQDHNYETIDGIHLTHKEARHVTEQLMQQVNQIIHQSVVEKHHG